MKKIISVILITILMSMLSITALGAEIPEQDEAQMAATPTPITEAETDEQDVAPDVSAQAVPDTGTAGVYATAGDLYRQWSMNYPAYICGVYSTDGSYENLTFAVTKDEAGEAGKAEILALVKDDSTVTFTYQSYPYAELRAIQEELTPYMGDDIGINSLGIDEMENVLTIGINSQTKTAETEHFMQECFEKYGNHIRFQDNEGIYIYTNSIDELSGGGSTLDKGTQTFQWYLFVSILLILLIGVFFFVRHPALEMQTTSGEVVNAAGFSVSETEELAKQAIIEPSEKLDNDILSKIEKL